MTICINSPVSFGQSTISKLNMHNNGSPLNFVEYDYNFYDMLHINSQTKQWESNQYENVQEFNNDFFRNYINGSYEKRYFGVEDENGNIQALIKADVQTDKENQEEFGTMKTSTILFGPDFAGSKTPELIKEITKALKKHSDSCKDIFAKIILRKTQSHSLDIDNLNGQQGSCLNTNI